MNFRLLFFITLFVLIVGCANKIEDGSVLTERTEASDFVLEISTPTVAKVGQMLKVKGKLTYVGDKPIELYHGEPIIRFSFTGTDIDYAYTDGGYRTQVKKGQTFEVGSEFKVTEFGKQSLIARTTLIEVDGKVIKGIGNEKYIKNDMSESNKELEDSKITLAPIVIEVNSK
ncbi:hypothetical protein [Schinkia azotoformans]|uniref:hypothetical protein n=1 Tax=Schinkia azotoformans TaxID=1454 RepID=UPI002DBA167A|nr:hypothetical protein [Schinkia azotoformans]MEC1759798.1 hypothetical protein [Schinkia azotoformans]